MSLSLGQRIKALQKTRHAVQAALEAQTGAPPADAKRLACLRTVVDSFAKQTDALIAMMTAGRGTLSGQVSEAEDLRAFFRLAVGCIEAQLDASPDDYFSKGSAQQVLDRHPRKPLFDPERELDVGLVLEIKDPRELGLVGLAPLPLAPRWDESGGPGVVSYAAVEELDRRKARTLPVNHF